MTDIPIPSRSIYDDLRTTLAHWQAAGHTHASFRITDVEAVLNDNALLRQKLAIIYDSEAGE